MSDGSVGICLLGLWDCVVRDLALLAYTQAAISPRRGGTGTIARIPEVTKKMLKRRRFIIGGLIILASLAYIIYGGMQEAIVYFATPSELKAKESASADKFLRMGGMVVTGSLQKDVRNLNYRFDLTDGNASFPVFFRGVPPDLFTEGKGAVVEGRIGADGVFQASTIMAKHAEEYSAHLDGKDGYQKSFVPGKESAQP
jgi:cytochrome c-type biogenesis protein CcmE